MMTDTYAVAGTCHTSANRLRAALLAFCGIAVAILIAVYTVAPEIYVQTLMLRPDPADAHPLAATALMGAIAVLVAVLAVGIVRRWRWLFWLVMAAFTLSALQIVALPFELAGILPPQFPVWYALSRGVVAVVQLVIGIWMIRLYRRCGVWGMGPARNAPSA